MNFQKRYKILLAGDSLVGKTTLVHLYRTQKVSSKPVPTIGCEHFIVNKFYENYQVRLIIWDTAGQERYRALSRSYYKGGQGIVLVFSITDRQSFLNVERWIEEIRNNIEEDGVFILVGNKIDLQKNRQVTFEEAFELSNRLNVSYYETSMYIDQIPSHGKSIEEIFYELVKQLLTNNNSQTMIQSSLELQDEKQKNCSC